MIAAARVRQPNGRDQQASSARQQPAVATSSPSAGSRHRRRFRGAESAGQVCLSPQYAFPHFGHLDRFSMRA